MSLFLTTLIYTSIIFNKKFTFSQFPLKPSDECRNMLLLGTDSFPDLPFMYNVVPNLSNSSSITTNPQDIKAILDVFKKQDKSLEAASKTKFQSPRPKRVSFIIVLNYFILIF